MALTIDEKWVGERMKKVKISLFTFSTATKFPHLCFNEHYSNDAINTTPTTKSMLLINQ